MTKRPAKLNNNKGMTLVELIVSFALLGLFMVAAGKVIADTVNLYYQAKSITTGMQVSNVINTKLTGMIEGALDDNSLVDRSSDKVSIRILDGGEKIELIDKTGSHIEMTGYKKSTDASGAVTSTPYMYIYYYPIITTDDEEGSTEPPVGSDWTFDKKTYMGYTIKELTFTKLDDIADADDPDKGIFPGNVIRINLTISSPRYGDYSTVTYVQCYNFRDPDSYKRIKTDY